MKHNLPAELASFIGRERELAEIRRILRTERLLTLTGPGGCGKTRLALRTGSDLVAQPLTIFPDGVWLIQLASIADSALVPRAVAGVLGVCGTAGRSLLSTLVGALASRQILLLLDNCEHVIGACARLAETLLGACPHLRILATSREPLRIPGEIIWRVPSLALPETEGEREAGSLSPESLARVEAVALFLERARSRRPDFFLTAENTPTVAAICRHLDGLPLGIELAAAQMGALTPEQIAVRLDDSLRLLGGGSRTLPRQETLRATLDWSYALLTEAEQTLFRRLSIFAGSFDVEAAEEVCGGEAQVDVFTALIALLDKSLVEPRVHLNSSRYRLLEPVRQYALVHLATHVETETMQRRHARYFLQLAEEAEPRLMSGSRGPWIERLASEQDNLRAALAWSCRATEQRDNEVGLRLAGALMWFWNFRGDVSEGLDWLEAALARGQTAAPAIRAKALYGAAELAWLLGQNAQALTRAEESATLWRELGDKRGLAYTLQSLPMAIDHPRAREAVEESLRLFEEIGDAWGIALALTGLDLLVLARGDTAAERAAEGALARWRELGDDWGAAQTLNILGDFARSQGDDADAAAWYQEALVLLRRQGLTGTVPSLLHNLAYLALRGGETRRALALFRESVQLFQSQGDLRGIADCLDGLAGTLGALRHPEPAARLFGAAESLRQSTGAAVWPANAVDYQRSLATARGQLDQAVFAAAWAAGRALPWEQAIAEALAAQPLSRPLRAMDGPDLTSREREVAVLVAQGLTNRQIGAALFVTEGTAKLHVKHVLQKLGFSSRAQVAGWAVAHGLVAAPEAT